MSDQKFRGVHPHKDGGWVVSIGHEGKHVYLGKFSDFDEAKTARLKAEEKLFGATFDRREIELCSDHAKVPLHGRGGVFHGWSIVDLDDVEVVRSVAWTIDPRGYVVGRPAGFKNQTPLHRWLILGSEKTVVTIDHRDRDKLNNRRSNLRECEQAENARNTALAKNNTSGKKGVSRSFNGTKWRARIWIDRKEIHLGVFATEAEAAAAYDKAAAELHGEFASPNTEIARASVEVRTL